MYQEKFEGSAAYDDDDDDEGMCQRKSEDFNVGMYRRKVEDCTHMKYTVLLNSRKHIRENIDDCTNTKFVMIGKFNGP